MDLIPRLGVGIDQRLVELDCGIVDEAVDTRQRAQHAFNRGSVGDVELDRAGAIGGEPVGADHVPSELGQVLADRRANPTHAPVTTTVRIGSLSALAECQMLSNGRRYRSRARHGTDGREPW